MSAEDDGDIITAEKNDDEALDTQQLTGSGEETDKDKLIQLLQSELEYERKQRQLEASKLSKAQKSITNLKSKLEKSKLTIDRLKKSKETTKRPPANRMKSGGLNRTGGEMDSDVEEDTPPPPGTPVLLSSSGTGASCRYCGKWFSDGYKLNRHMVVHSGFKPFVCDWPGCGRPFDSNYKLQRHRRCHTGERPFACDVCDKRFTRSDKLKEHQRLHLQQEAKQEHQQQQQQQQADVVTTIEMVALPVVVGSDGVLAMQ